MRCGGNLVLIKPLHPAAVLLAGFDGLGAVYIFPYGADNLLFLHFAIHILRNVPRVIGQGTSGYSRLAIDAPCFKGNGDFRDGR